MKLGHQRAALEHFERESSDHEGRYLAEPSPANSIELVLPEEWSTDDDTAVEWVDLPGFLMPG